MSSERRFLLFASLFFLLLAAWYAGFMYCMHTDAVSSDLLGTHAKDYPGASILLLVLGPEPSGVFLVALLVLFATCIFFAFKTDERK